jgi:hypothetical protein
MRIPSKEDRQTVIRSLLAIVGCVTALGLETGVHGAERPQSLHALFRAVDELNVSACEKNS